MILQPTDRERSYFHLGLGTGAGIPQPVAQLELAMNAIRSATQETYIQKILDRCDDAFDQCYPGALTFGKLERISGDINRSIQQFNNLEDFSKAWDIYLAQVDLLSFELRVDNFRRMENPRFSNNFSGGEYINVVPGPNDTATGATIYNLGVTGGGVGIPAF